MTANVENDALFEAHSSNPQALNEAHADRADATYLEGAADLPVQDDQEAREDLDNSPHTAATNAQLGTSTLHTSAHTVAGASVKVYSGGNIVNSTDYDAFKRGVYDAVQADHSFSTSGQVPPEGATSKGDFNTDHVDPLILIEASKLTGEKHF